MSTIWREDFLTYAKDFVLIISETLFYFLKTFYLKFLEGVKCILANFFYLFYGWIALFNVFGLLS